MEWLEVGMKGRKYRTGKEQDSLTAIRIGEKLCVCARVCAHKQKLMFSVCFSTSDKKYRRETITWKRSGLGWRWTSFFFFLHYHSKRYFTLNYETIFFFCLPESS